MGTTDDARDDDQLASLLAEFETQLATGRLSTIPAESLTLAGNGAESERLEADKQCVLLLEEIWPHQRPPDQDLPLAIGRFRILRELGRGGFSIVYLAHDDRLGREVALKVQRPEALLSQDLRERFLREAKAAARLKHAHIAAVHEVGEAGLQVWIASEFVAGDSLAAWLRKQTVMVPPRTAAQFLVPLAEAVDFAHRAGVLHRDLKPSNVLLEPVDDAQAKAAGLEGYRPQLIDFGLAKLDEVAHHETRSGALIGTPPYMAPEQAMGNVRAIGPATDVYGLGTIMYELLTARPAFGGENDVQTLRKVLDDDPPAPRKLRSEVPVDLDAICLKCLAKQPHQRYASPAALADDLKRFISGQPTLARPASAGERLLKWARRRPGWAAFAAVSAAAAVAIVALTWVYIARLRDANDAAETSRLAALRSAEVSARNEQLANQYLYSSRMRLAQQAIEQGDVRQGRELLAHYADGSPLGSLRGFEWHLIERGLHRELHTFRGHTGQVYGVTFTPDGRQIVSGSQDGTIRFWDVAKGVELATLKAHSSCVNILAYAPDGKLLASGSCDHTIKLWDAATRDLVATLEGQPGEVHCLAFCPTDSNLLAAGGHETGLAVWNVAERKVVHPFPGKINAHGVAWSRDGSTIHAAGWGYRADETRACSWRPSDGHVEHDDLISLSVATAPDDGVCWGGHNTIRLRSPQHVYRTYPVAGTPQALAFSPQGDLLAATVLTQSIRLLDRDTLASLQVFSGHTDRVQTLAFSPTDSGVLASASFDGTLKLWKYPTGEQSVHHFRVRSRPSEPIGRSIAISADLRYLAFAQEPDEICVQDLSTGSERFLHPVSHYRHLAFPGNGTTLLALPITSDHVDEWDVAAWKSLRSLPLSPQSTCTRFADNLLETANEMLIITNLTTGEVWHRAGGADARFITSPDGRSLVIDAGPNCWLLEASRPRQLVRVPNPEQHLVYAVSNGGDWTVFATDQNTIALVETRAGRVTDSMRHAEPVGHVAFSPDGKTLAVDAAGIHLYSVANGQEAARLVRPAGGCEHLRFSADGRHLAVITTSGLESGIPQPPGAPIPAIDEAAGTLTIYHGPE
jgi:WD40 repeat protein/tRNA A-37 threonylcarbamoyl transferase component Bud32